MTQGPRDPDNGNRESPVQPQPQRPSDDPQKRSPDGAVPRGDGDGSDD